MRRMIRAIEDIQMYVSAAKRKHHFELGEMYINEDNIVYVIEDTYREHFERAIATISGLRYTDKAMVQEFLKYFPLRIKDFEVEDKLVLILNKPRDVILLKDVFDYYKGHMDPKAVAWIISSLYNVAMYFRHAKIVHNDISLSTYFISPSEHNGALLGGWWYSAKDGDEMKSLPTRTFNFLDKDTRNSKKANPVIDLDLIRATGRELLGDLKGNKLLSMNVAPEAMVNWLRLCSAGNVRDDYKIWKNEVIPEAFGGRFFTPMSVKTELHGITAVTVTRTLIPSDVYEEVK